MVDNSKRRYHMFWNAWLYFRRFNSLLPNPQRIFSCEWLTISFLFYGRRLTTYLLINIVFLLIIYDCNGECIAPPGRELSLLDWGKACMHPVHPSGNAQRMQIIIPSKFKLMCTVNYDRGRRKRYLQSGACGTSWKRPGASELRFRRLSAQLFPVVPYRLFRLMWNLCAKAPLSSITDQDRSPFYQRRNSRSCFAPYYMGDLVEDLNLSDESSDEDAADYTPDSRPSSSLPHKQPPSPWSFHWSEQRNAWTRIRPYWGASPRL